MRWLRPILLAVSLGFVLLDADVAPAQDALRFTAAELHARGVVDGLRLSADRASLELVRGILHEDDGPAAGYSYQPNEETLSESVWVRKQLVVENPRAERALLLVAPGGTLRTRINGRWRELPPAVAEGNYWKSYAIEPQWLTAGLNEIVLTGTGKLWIARDDEYAPGAPPGRTPPGRSAKSTDQGKTWSSSQLGTRGDIDGEYYVRLFLDQHAPRGTLRSEVFDLVAPRSLGVSPVQKSENGHRRDAGETAVIGRPVASLSPVKIQIKADTARPDDLTVRLRSGTAAVPHDERWSGWRDLPAGATAPGGSVSIEVQPVGRYAQLEIELCTANPLTTPRFYEVSVAPALPGADDWTGKLELVEQHNPRIVRSSIPFQYEPFDYPRLAELRSTHKLDDVVRGAKSEWDLVVRLAQWSATRWQGLGHLRSAYPPWDALEILQEHPDGGPVGGFCQQFNLVFLQACLSFGITGRAVSIGPGYATDKIRGGHEVVEIWSNDHGKWAYIDGNTGWYAVDRESRLPLSLLELRERQLQALGEREPRPIEIVRFQETRFDWPGLTRWPPFVELRLIPRNNFLQQAAPLPLNQGMRGWFWTGHYVWSDERAPARPLYSHYVTSRQNFEWTLNQVHWTLEASQQPGLLHVHLDTQTPGLETLLARIDGEPPRPVGALFDWKLREGENRLHLTARNTAGREGPASFVALQYEP